MLQYIPKYVRQVSDMQYGDTVTHENYNEKLNLNSTQGDYNTEVLDKLLNEVDVNNTYHIGYIDEALKDINTNFNVIDKTLENHAQNIQDNRDAINSNSQAIVDIINGATPVEHARVSDSLASEKDAGPKKYYGTNKEGVAEFIKIPPLIYAEPIDQTAEIDGIYIVPQPDSVTEAMLTEVVRKKLNDSAATDYNQLANKPMINSVLLTGDVSLEELGIQTTGDFVTNTFLTDTLTGYSTTTATTNAIQTAVADLVTNTALDTQLENYIDTTTLADVLSIYSLKSETPTIQVGPTFTGDPKDGDLLIMI